MRYRYRLGQTLGEDIVKDGDFPSGSINWNFGGDWSIPIGGGEANAVLGGILDQDCGLVSGVRYRIDFELSDMVGGSSLQVYLSGFSVISNPLNNFLKTSNGSYTLEGTCLSLNPRISFLAIGTVTISNVVVYPYEWNAPLTDEPSGWKESSIKINKSDIFDNLFVKYSEDLLFYGDGYDYLYTSYSNLAALSPKEFCEIVPIKIERLIAGTWETHFEGVIYLTDCTFDLCRKTVNCNIEDRVGASAIRMNRKKIVQTLMSNTPVLPIGAYSNEQLTYALSGIANNAGGRDNRNVIFVYGALRNMVHEITDLSVTVISNLLNNDNYEGIANQYQYLGITDIRNFANTTPAIALFTSLEDLLNDLDIMICIGLLSAFPNNIPTLAVESRKFLQGSAMTFTLDNNSSIFRFYDDMNFHSFELGYERPNEADGEDPVGAFRQMREWSVRKYAADVQCNDRDYTKLSKTSTQSQWIHNQLATTIYDPVAGTGLKIPYTPRNFFITLKYVAPNFLSREWAYAGGTENNEYLKTDICMQRWVDAVLNTTYQSPDIQNTFALYNDLEEFIYKTNDPLVRVWEFEVPVTLDEYDEVISNPFNRVKITSNCLTGTIEGYIIDFSFSNKTDHSGRSMATFKILTA